MKITNDNASNILSIAMEKLKNTSISLGPCNECGKDSYYAKGRKNYCRKCLKEHFENE